jgi:hypothetical protein
MTEAGKEREIGSYMPVTLAEVQEFTPEGRQLALEIAAADAHDITVALEVLAEAGFEGNSLSEAKFGVQAGELEERLQWLSDLLRKVKLARHSFDESAAVVVDIDTNKL